MQPKLYFDRGFCNYDCTICGDVCPTGAILPLSVEEKNHTQMGQVQFILENCIVYYDETSCGACSEHCPTQAVHMVPYKGHLTIPETDISICVGCGGCEYVCPAIPFKAIYVEGIDTQNIIEIENEEIEEIVIDDFGF
jgi:ferredoxin